MCFGWKEDVALAHSVGSWAEKQRVLGSGPSVEKQLGLCSRRGGKGKDTSRALQRYHRATSQTPKCSHRGVTL